MWLSVRPDNQKSRRTTKNTDVVVRRTTINFHAPAVKLYPVYLVPSIRTTKKLDGQPDIVTLFFPNSNTVHDYKLHPSNIKIAIYTDFIG